MELGLIIVFLLCLFIFIDKSTTKPKEEEEEWQRSPNAVKKPETHSIESESELYEKSERKKFDKQQYKDYLKTLQWFDLKMEVYKRDSYRCRQCHKDLSKFNGEVHHTHYDNIYNEKLEDLVLVCPECHELIHTYYSKLLPLQKNKIILSATQLIEAKELVLKK